MGDSRRDYHSFFAGPGLNGAFRIDLVMLLAWLR